MITKKAIRKQIEELEKEIQWYNGHINRLLIISEKLGYIVMKDDYHVVVYHKDHTRANFIMSNLDQEHGIIRGLQMAIDQLKNLL